jgi:hypothetical protein
MRVTPGWYIPCHGIYHGTPKVRQRQREIRRIFRSTMVCTMVYDRVNTPLGIRERDAFLDAPTNR